MATDYGTDLAALDDLPDPEVLVSGTDNAAYAQARRLLTPAGAMAEIGDGAEYDSLDVRAALGGRLDAQQLADLQTEVEQVLAQDPRVLRVAARVTLPGGALQVAAEHDGTDGPFDLVLGVSAITAATLQVT